MPDYLIRFLRSLLSIGVLGLPMSMVVTGGILFLRPDRATRLARVLLAYLACVVTGAAVAALDAHNVQHWNPALFGSPFVGLSLPLMLYYGVPRHSPKRINITVMAAVAAIPIALIVASFGGEFLAQAYKRGWPTSW